MGWMLPEPAPRDWNSGIHNYGTLHTFAVGDTVTIIGLTASSEQQLNGLSALVTAEDGKDRWLVQPMTSTAGERTQLMHAGPPTSTQCSR